MFVTRAHQLVVLVSQIYLLSFIETDTWLLMLLKGVEDGDEEALNKVDVMFPFLLYASRYFVAHFRHAKIENLDAPEFVLTKKLFDPTYLYRFLQVWWVTMDRKRSFEDYEYILWGPITEPQRANRLCHASCLGLTAVVRWLLQEGDDVNAPSDQGFRYPLIMAAFLGDEAIVGLLLDFGADIEATDNRWNTALCKAACNGNTALVRSLLDRRANIHTAGRFGTPLDQAVYCENESTVRMLIDAGADVNVRAGLFTYRLRAALNQRRSQTGVVPSQRIVQLLLDNTRVLGRPVISRSALHEAATHVDDGITRLLLKNGADVHARDASDDTPLHAAASLGRVANIRLLLESGADITARSDSSGLALHMAAASGQLEAVRTLLEAGSDVNAHGGKYANALQVAAANPFKIRWDVYHEVAITQLLLDYGADVDARGGMYGSALAAANSERGSRRVITLLKQYGAHA